MTAPPSPSALHPHDEHTTAPLPGALASATGPDQGASTPDPGIPAVRAGAGCAARDGRGAGRDGARDGRGGVRAGCGGTDRDAAVGQGDADAGSADGTGTADAAPAALAPPARLLPALDAVYRAQLSRARVARIPLLCVAVFQSVGIMVLMRGVVDDESGARAVVAGSSVLVVAFVALNLLAQYFGRLRAGGGLDHYATLPVPPAAVVLGTAAAYASFTVPGTALTAAVGCLLFHLPMAHLWVLAAVIPLTGAALSGLGAALGLLASRAELATLLGQLGMSAALLLGVLPAARLPRLVQYGRDLLPSTYGVEAVVRTFAARPDWYAVGLDLGVCAAVGVVSLTIATWSYRRAAVR